MAAGVQPTRTPFLVRLMVLVKIPSQGIIHGCMRVLLTVYEGVYMCVCVCIYNIYIHIYAGVSSESERVLTLYHIACIFPTERFSAG